MPRLKGCWSQGTTEAEALENIRDAIDEYLLTLKLTVGAADEEIREVSIKRALPKLSGINHQTAVRAFEKGGWILPRQGKHLVMMRGSEIIVIPRYNPANVYTMAGIVADAGLTIEEFKRLI